MDRIAELRGEGRWVDALELVRDPLARADLLNEQALFAGDAEARAAATRELDRAEALLLLERGRVLHAAFLADPQSLTRRSSSCSSGRTHSPARPATRCSGWVQLWIGLFHQVVGGDGARARPFFEEAYDTGARHGDRVLRSYATRHLAWEDEAAGDADRAWERWEESVALRREEGFLPGVAAGLLTLGEVAGERGRGDEARRLLAEARELAVRSNADAIRARVDATLQSISEP